MTTELTRTPGSSWMAERTFDYDEGGVIWAVVGLTDAGNDLRTIARVGGPHAEGDARLLAEAPALLSLLQDALTMFAPYMEGGEEDEWVKFSRAAVARATRGAQ